MMFARIFPEGFRLFDAMRTIGVGDLRKARGGPTLNSARTSRQTYLGGPRMTWKTPKIVEVQVGMEINMYACAARK
jgi:coenzyme PQQ precursor peptide PqqA